MQERLEELIEEYFGEDPPSELGDFLRALSWDYDEVVRQRSFLRDIVDVDPSFIFAKDREGRYTFVNSAVAEIYGTTVSGLVGRTDADFNADAEEVAQFRRDDLEVMDSGREKLIAEERITGPDGRTRYVQTVKRPLKDEDGTIRWVLGVGTDITDRKRFERHLQRDSELAQTKQEAMEELAHLEEADFESALQRVAAKASELLDVRQVGIWLFSDDRKSIVCGHLCRDGKADPEAHGTRIEATDYPAYFEALTLGGPIAADDAATDPRTREFAVDYLPAHGITSMLDVGIRSGGRLVGIVCHEHIGPPRRWTLDEQDLAASLAGFVALALERSRRRELADQLRQSQKMEAVGLLAGGIAHDFNNMLNIILGFGDLARGALDADHPTRRHLEKIVATAQRGSELTAKLLSFSRRQVLATRPLDLNEVLGEFGSLLDRIVGEDVAVVIDHGREPLVVRADRTQLEQVLLNLCGNARQAMPQGGQLSLSVARSRKHFEDGEPRVRLSVRDTGSGIDPEVLRRIWEPFFTTKSEGTGLGLAVVYGIVDQHQGTIDVESAPGSGTTFHLYLPEVRGVQPSALDRPVAQVAGGHETILVAEDEAMLRELVATVLDEQGYTVLTAADGDEALARFRRHPEIALVILDVVMPEVGGPQAYREMRRIRPDLPAIFATGYAPEGGELTEALESGRVSFLTKPFRVDELAVRIREMLDAPGTESENAG